jgi:hypothetical protein
LLCYDAIFYASSNIPLFYYNFNYDVTGVMLLTVTGFLRDWDDAPLAILRDWGDAWWVEIMRQNEVAANLKGNWIFCFALS